MDCTEGDPPAPIERPRFPGMHYILADDMETPIDCPDVLEWARWWEPAEHRVVKHDIVGDYLVSTIFTGIPSPWSMIASDMGRGDVRPELWETMIFRHVPVSRFNEETRRSETGPELDCSQESLPEELAYYQTRYASRAEAIAGHTRAVDAVLAVLGK